MKLLKYVLLFILTIYTFVSAECQDKKFNYFGSYNYGVGYITSKVSSDLGYPLSDEVQKLKNGTINQFEFGVFYHSFGLGFIHNSYSSNVSTSYENADVNADTDFENGILSDNLNLNFNGLELLYKLPFLDHKFDFTLKVAPGFQSYSIDKEIRIMGTYPSQTNYTLSGNRLTALTGIEVNYQLWKIIGIGLESSFLPGNYTKLKNEESPSYIYSDNVQRLSAGVKIKITI